MDKNELIKTLLTIDEEVELTFTDCAVKPRVIIVGGSALLINDVTPRKTTHDIDVYESDSRIRSIITQYPNVNTSVSAYWDSIPYNFEDRLIPLSIGSRMIDYYTPSIEDLVVMKLYAYRENDISDIMGAVDSGSLDWDLLEKLIYSNEEARASMNSDRRYKEMLSCFEDLKEKIKERNR